MRSELAKGFGDRFSAGTRRLAIATDTRFQTGDKLISSHLQGQNLLVHRLNAHLDVSTAVQRAGRTRCQGLERPAYLFQREADLLIALDERNYSNSACG